MTTKPDLILHIGTEKTGTTSIQEFLAINKARLQQQSFTIPDFLGRKNHAFIAFAAYERGQEDDITRAAMKDFDGGLEERKKEIQEQLKIASTRTSSSTWIITSEHLSTRLTSIESVLRLRKILDKSFSSTKVIVYLREPLSAYLASLSTSIKSGSCSCRLPNPGEGYADRIANHKGLLQRWIEAFGRENLAVRLYEGSHLENGDLLDDFCKTARIETSSDFKRPTRQNQSLSHAAMKALCLLNQELFSTPDEEGKAILQSLSRRIQHSLSDLPLLAPPQGSQAQWDTFYRESSEFVRTEFFPELKGKLWSTTPYPAAADEQALDLSILEERLIQLLVSTWTKTNSREQKLKKQIKKLRKRLERRHGRGSTHRARKTRRGESASLAP